VQVTKIAGQVVGSLLSIAGIRVGTEEPHFIRRPLTNGVEIRQYGPRIAAETTVAGDEERARSIGFRRLARYIFGGNHRDEGIGMMAPVAQQSMRGDKIAMTAPVAQSLIENGRWTIRFHAVEVEVGDTSHARRRQCRACDSPWRDRRRVALQWRSQREGHLKPNR